MGSCLLIQFFFWSWTLVTCSMCKFLCKLFCWGLFFKWRFSFWDQRHWQHRSQGSVMNSPLGRKTGTPVSVSCFSIWEAWNDWFLNLLPSFVADYFARNERLCRKNTDCGHLQVILTLFHNINVGWQISLKCVWLF